MGVSLIPRDDQSEYEVTVTTPEGYSLERTSKLLTELEDRIWKLKGTQHVFTTIGETEGGRVVKGEGDVTRATIYVRMADLEERDYTQFAVQQEAREILEDYPDLRVSVNDVSPFQGGRRPQTFQVNLAGPDLNKLAEYAEPADRRAEEGARDWWTSTRRSRSASPRCRCIVDREAASDLGVPVGTIADSLRVLVGGPAGLEVPRGRPSNTTSGSAPWPAIAAPTRTSTSSPSPRRPSAWSSWPAWRSWSRIAGRREIERLGRERIVTVLGNPEGIPLGEAVDRAEKVLKGMNLPPQYSLHLHGPGQDAGRDRLLLPGRVRALDHFHVPDPGRPVRELDAADRHPDGLAGHDPVRHALAGPVPDADGPLRDVRPVHAGRDRQEERHPPGRRDQPAPGEGTAQAPRRSSRPTTRGCGRS